MFEKSLPFLRRRVVVTLRLSGKRKSSASVTVRLPDVKQFVGLVPDNSTIAGKLVLGLATVERCQQYAGAFAMRDPTAKTKILDQLAMPNRKSSCDVLSPRADGTEVPSAKTSKGFSD